jgi:formamidopyrimidine-DNA glycosylase
MPELPDIQLYLHALKPRVVGKTLQRARIVSPFLLRTFDPPIEAVEGQSVRELRRIGKRIVLCFDDELFLVVHLMIAGRFRWSDKVGTKSPGKIGLASFDFDTGTLLFVESSPKKRASLHVLRGVPALAGMDPGGLNVFDIDLATFARQIHRENHTIKRTLTDPRFFDGIGNAYSDEILHAAQVSPVKLTQRMEYAEIERLYHAARSTLRAWSDRLIAEFGNRFPGPGDVTAFRPDFAVHGKFGKPCPVCGTLVQRIRFAENETNYCPRCQTDGKVLADRSLSRLLKDDWPRSIEELEEKNWVHEGTRRNTKEACMLVSPLVSFVSFVDNHLVASLLTTSCTAGLPSAALSSRSGSNLAPAAASSSIVFA